MRLQNHFQSLAENLVPASVLFAITLSFVVLPLLVSAVTPFKYRDLLSIPRDTLITIFATAKIIVVLPQLVENIKELFRRYDLEDEEVDHGAEIILPLAYPFPNLGTFTILMFIPVSAWYLGNSLDLPEQMVFYGSAFLSSFVAPIIGIPFLGFDVEMAHHLAEGMGVQLEMVRIEREDISQLFISGQVDIVMSGLGIVRLIRRSVDGCKLVCLWLKLLT